MSRSDPRGTVTPELMLRAYAAGIFPMAESRDNDVLHWIDPERRGILPLDGFHLSRSLRRQILRARFDVSIDTDFAGVIRSCADREETWINRPIERLSIALHQMGYAHSIELHDGAELVGGVYGVVLGTAFFGESMFSRRDDASKIALAHLVARLRGAGFTLFDTQFVTPHLIRLGAREISRSKYRGLLRGALARRPDCSLAHAALSPQEVVQRITQTS